MTTISFANDNNLVSFQNLISLVIAVAFYFIPENFQIIADGRFLLPLRGMGYESILCAHLPSTAN
jgi:hypothetical protein